MTPEIRIRPCRLLPFITIVLLSALTLTEAHQSLSFPYPMSRHVACRIDDHIFCPGPCPNSKFRLDMTPNNPSMTVRRGNWVKIRSLSNNHRGGFNRWTIVHVKDMGDHAKHRKHAFLYSCGDTWMRKCTKRTRRRDCRHDRENLHFLHKIQIPKIYPDGVYVLGWVWYGGITNTGEWGRFGDYYDCMYLRIKGGPMEDSHRPIFKAGKTAKGEWGMCRATVNKVGICRKEPCLAVVRPPFLQRPYEFINGRKPEALKQKDFLKPYASKSRTKGSPVITSMKIVSADRPEKVYSDSRWTRFPYIKLTKSMGVTVTCDVRGQVKAVVFYDNGNKGKPNYKAPYSIAGEWVEKGVWKFAPWKLNIDKTVTTISCQAVGFDGTEHWKTIELSTDM